MTGGIYHTVKGGNNREAIFHSDADRWRYLNLLAHYKGRFRFQVYGYVLLPDHIHLLLEPGPVSLPRIMHALHGAYARYFNQTHGRWGHLFAGRYLAGPCAGAAHFWDLLCWLHLHPVRSGLAATADAYPWSSHGAYLGTDKMDMVDAAPVLLTLDPLPGEAREKYRQLLAQNREGQGPASNGAWEEAAAAGSLPGGVEQGGAAVKILPQLVSAAARVAGTTVERMRSDAKTPPVVLARALVSYLGLRHGYWTAAEIARALNKHPATVIRGAERLEKGWNEEIQDLVETLWGTA